MELMNLVKLGILQCEERYKIKLEQEKMSPYQKHLNTYMFVSYIVNEFLQSYNRELLIFVPKTDSAPYCVVQKQNETLEVKEILDENFLTIFENDFEDFDYALFDESLDKSEFSVLFEYCFHNKKRGKVTRVVWRILNAITSTKYQRVRILIRHFEPPAPFDKTKDLPRGYLFVVLSDRDLSKLDRNEKFVFKNNVDIYREYLKKYDGTKPTLHNKANTNLLFDNYSNQVFIGGSYTYMAILNDIKGVVAGLGYAPILVCDYEIPRNRIHNVSLRLLHNCKYAIFDVTHSQGDLMEIERARDYGCIVLYLYQDVNRPLDHGLPQGISTMLSSYVKDMQDLKKYSTFSEMKVIIEKWLSPFNSNYR